MEGVLSGVPTPHVKKAEPRSSRSRSGSRAPSPKPSGEKRCQKAICLNMQRENTALRKEIKQLQNEIERLKKSHDTEVEGKYRARVEAPLADLQSKISWYEDERSKLKRDRNRFGRRAVEAEEEVVLQAHTIRELSAQILHLKGVAGAAARKEAATVRAAHAKEGQLKVQLAKTKGLENKRLEKMEKEVATRIASLQEQLEQAEGQMAEAEAEMAEALERAREAQATAEAAEQDAIEARKEASDAKYLATSSARREARTRAKMAEQSKKLADAQAKAKEGPCDRSEEEWAALSREARWKASQRERGYLTTFLTSHEWRMEDVAAALDELDWVKMLFETMPIFSEHFRRVFKLIEKMEHECFGPEFGAFLHYDMNLTFEKIVRLTQAACKDFDRKNDRYKSKVLLSHPFIAKEVVKVPRIAPPFNQLLVLKKDIESTLGVQSSEDGRLAFRSLAVVVQELLAQDPGTRDMPPLPAFLGGALELPIVIEYDATGFGTQQLNTVALRNPYMSQSAQHLRIFGLGNCSDDRQAPRLTAPRPAPARGDVPATIEDATPTRRRLSLLAARRPALRIPAPPAPKS